MNDSAKEKQAVVKGIFLKYKIFAIIIAVIIIAYAATVLGLVFGLLNRCKSIDKALSVDQSHDNDISTNEKPTYVTITSKTTTTSAQKVKINYRLPHNLKPYYYDLTITTKFYDIIEPTDFDGDVKINFTCLSNTNKLVLHMRDIDLVDSSILIKGVTDTSFDFHHIKWTYDNQTHFLTFELNKQFQVNHNYTVHIKYKGYIKDNGAGFYQSSYIDAQGNKKLIEIELIIIILF